MPTYQYRCVFCTATDVVIEPITSEETHMCPFCNLPMRREIGAPMIVFDGKMIERPIIKRDKEGH